MANCVMWEDKVEPCIRVYVKMAYDNDITQEELIEFSEVAMTMQGCSMRNGLSRPMRRRKIV